VVTGIFGHKREAVTGEWIKLHKEKIHAMYLALSTFRMMNEEARGGRDVDYA
jgi:late competence protein required for DNA uptake (superfamily II DNA/RNA helicase)